MNNSAPVIWSQLFETKPFRFAFHDLNHKHKIGNPTDIYVEGNRKLIFEWEFKGRTSSQIVLQAVWDLISKRFYYTRFTKAPAHFGTPSYLDSPLMTRREFIKDLATLHNQNPNFKLKKADQARQVSKNDVKFLAHYLLR